MITKIEASKRFLADHGWLKTHLLFSFADYQDPNNVQFGNLRVFNDDVIAPGAGFPEHPHENMEIVTIVLEGKLTHKDSIGNIGTINPGEVQHMTAGSGIIHAEYNNSNHPVHLYQIWLFPREKNLTPTYGQKNFSNNFIKNKLLPIASGSEQEGAMKMQTEATIYVTELETNNTISYVIPEKRGIFMYIQSGNVLINNLDFISNDQARIVNEKEITITAQENSKFIMIEVLLN